MVGTSLRPALVTDGPQTYLIARLQKTQHKITFHLPLTTEGVTTRSQPIFYLDSRMHPELTSLINDTPSSQIQKRWLYVVRKTTHDEHDEIWLYLDRCGDPYYPSRHLDPVKIAIESLRRAEHRRHINLPQPLHSRHDHLIDFYNIQANVCTDIAHPTSPSIPIPDETWHTKAKTGFAWLDSPVQWADRPTPSTGEHPDPLPWIDAISWWHDAHHDDMILTAYMNTGTGSDWAWNSPHHWIQPSNSTLTTHNPDMQKLECIYTRLLYYINTYPDPDLDDYQGHLDYVHIISAPEVVRRAFSSTVSGHYKTVWRVGADGVRYSVKVHVAGYHRGQSDG